MCFRTSFHELNKLENWRLSLKVTKDLRLGTVKVDTKFDLQGEIRVKDWIMRSEKKKDSKMYSCKYKFLSIPNWKKSCSQC